MLRFGNYDQKVTFKEYGVVSNGSGGFKPSSGEKDIISVWANVSQIKHRSTMEVLQGGLPATYRVRIQKRSGFTPKVGMILTWKGDNYKIVSSPVVEGVRIGLEYIFDVINSNG